MQEIQDLIGYDEIIENSMRTVIYETLKKVENAGLPGKHYFIITFSTNFAGVSIPKKLKAKYQDEMTIVIQYQYKDLKVDHNFFNISLSFDGQYETLQIPYRAVTSFADPSMNFGLKFTIGIDDDELKEPEITKNSNSKKSNLDLSAKVVSLDAFRKDKNNNN